MPESFLIFAIPLKVLKKIFSIPPRLAEQGRFRILRRDFTRDLHWIFPAEGSSFTPVIQRKGDCELKGFFPRFSCYRVGFCRRLAGTGSSGGCPSGGKAMHIVIETNLGDLTAELYPDKRR
jgi:hypothetical protein